MSPPSVAGGAPLAVLRAAAAWRADFSPRPAIDARAAHWPPERSLAVLLFVGQGGEVMQPQIHERFFAGRSEAIVSRCVRKLAARGLLAIDRWQRVGVNRLRLTPRGRDLLLSAGIPEHELFVLRKPVAMAHVAHTAWINDLRVVVSSGKRAPEFAFPAWAIQRLLRPLPPTIPDLLVAFARDAGAPLLLAVEIDLGTERLKTVFVPKLTRLPAVLRTWSPGPVAIIVLTSGVRRAASLRSHLDAACASVDVVVDVLPTTTGRRAITDLRAQLEFLR